MGWGGACVIDRSDALALLRWKALYQGFDKLVFVEHRVLDLTALRAVFHKREPVILCFQPGDRTSDVLFQDRVRRFGRRFVMSSMVHGAHTKKPGPTRTACHAKERQQEFTGCNLATSTSSWALMQLCLDGVVVANSNFPKTKLTGSPGRFGGQVSVTDIYHTTPYHTTPLFHVARATLPFQKRSKLLQRCVEVDRVPVVCARTTKKERKVNQKPRALSHAHDCLHATWTAHPNLGNSSNCYSKVPERSQRSRLLTLHACFG